MAHMNARRAANEKLGAKVREQSKAIVQLQNERE